MYMKTTAQKAQQQKAMMVARLHALDPNGSLSGWSVWQSYQELMDTFFYLTDRKAAA